MRIVLDNFLILFKMIEFVEINLSTQSAFFANTEAFEVIQEFYVPWSFRPNCLII